MRLEGIHHVTAITADAPGNVDFYARVLGLRLVKKSVNQDDPTVYHLFYGDDEGSPGSDITFFEYPNARRGSAGAGMVHRVVWRVASTDALAFWEGVSPTRTCRPSAPTARCCSPTPKGWRTSSSWSRPRTSRSSPTTRRFRRSSRSRASTPCARTPPIPSRAGRFLEQTLAFDPGGEAAWEVRGEQRGSFYYYDRTDERGVGGAGTVHHVAWSSTMDEHEAWQKRVAEAGASPTPVIDRFYFKSIYFREPSGVLFEIATIGPRLRRRRAARAPRRAPVAAAELRAAPRPARAGADSAARPARGPRRPVTIEHRARPPAGDAEGLLVLFHGRGADEHDLFPLLDVLDPERRLLGVTARGPLSLPPGGAHWYTVREIGYPDPDTFLATYAAVSSWLDALAEETGIPPERTVLGGFSQGAVMTYSLGLGLGRPRPAALVALSGFIPTVEGFELDLGPPPPRVAIGHGTADPVISVEWSRLARRALEEAGADVLYREYPLPHTVDPRFLQELAPWIASALYDRATGGR